MVFSFHPMVGSWASLEAEGFLETKQNRTFHLVSGSAQEAEKQRVENEKNLFVPRKSANQNSHRSPRRLSDRLTRGGFSSKEGGSESDEKPAESGRVSTGGQAFLFPQAFQVGWFFHSIR